jgi:hypothetical protein
LDRAEIARLRVQPYGPGEALARLDSRISGPREEDKCPVVGRLPAASCHTTLISSGALRLS